MDIVASIVNAVVIVAVGFVLDRMAKGRHADLAARVDRLEQRVDGMRPDLTAVALAVGAQPRAGNA